MTNHDIVIIGGGPAGMAAAVAAYDAGCTDVVILEREPSIGGILMLLFYTFQNFIPGIAFLPRPVALAITALIVVVSLLLFLPELKWVLLCSA